MNHLLNRRELLRQTAAGLTTFFCVGRLEFDSEEDCEHPDLCLAAATTFEFWIQKLFIPYGLTEGKPDFSPEVRAKAYEVSKWLNPSNGPQIFSAAQVLSGKDEIFVRFSDSVSISLPRRSIGQLRCSIAKHPGAHMDPSRSDEQVVEYIVESFTFPENYRYD
jgi:hypothetical protein